MPNQLAAERLELVLSATAHLDTEALRGGVVSRKVAYGLYRACGRASGEWTRSLSNELWYMLRDSIAAYEQETSR